MTIRRGTAVLFVWAATAHSMFAAPCQPGKSTEGTATSVPGVSVLMTPAKPAEGPFYYRGNDGLCDPRLRTDELLKR